MRAWIVRAAARALPAAWRASIVRDLEDEAGTRRLGTLWLVAEIGRVAVRLRFSGSAGTFVDDVRYVVRSLTRAKGFTAAAVLTFTLGIGMNIAVFSVIDRLMFRPLPYADAGRLVHLRQVTLPATGDGLATSNILGEVSLALAKYGHAFSGVAWAQGGGLRTSPAPDAPPLTLSIATANLLDVLGVRAELGRSFVPEDVADPGVQSVMLTHEAWQRRFNGSDRVLTMTWGARPVYRVVGVLPKGFLLPTSRFMEECDGIFTAPTSAPMLNAIPGALAVGAVARLRPGVSIAEAEADAARVLASVEAWGSAPLLNVIRKGTGNERVIVEPLRSGLARLVGPYLWLISAGAWVLLAVACVNLATLLLARGRSRERDVAVRAALGASPLRVARVAALESLALCVLSGLAALVVCTAGQSLVLTIVPPELRGFAVAPQDARVVAISLGVSFAAACLAAIVPALRAVRVDLSSALGREAAGRVARGLRGGAALLAIEAALGAALVVGATVSVPAFLELVYGWPGYRPGDLFTVYAAHGSPMSRRGEYSREEELAARPARVANVLAALRDVPGVERAAVSFDGPGYGDTTFWQSRGLRGRQTAVSEGWLETMGTALVAGRALVHDDIARASPVAVINESAAHALWPGIPVDAVLGRIVPASGGDRAVVGVAEDVHLEPGQPAEPTLYVPITSPTEHPRQTDLAAIVRMRPGTAPDAAAIADRLNQRFPPGRVRVASLEERVQPFLRRPRFLAVLFGSVASVAMMLAGLGLYAVASFEMLRRQHEMGVRLALGGSRGDVARRLLGVTLRPVLAGTLVGLCVAWWMSAAAQAVVVGASTRSPWAYVGAAVVMIATGAIATWRPAVRSARVDPAVVLRAL